VGTANLIGGEDRVEKLRGSLTKGRHGASGTELPGRIAGVLVTACGSDVCVATAGVDVWVEE
jgi:hypothetical protein